jgi:hypothetical protein
VAGMCSAQVHPAAGVNRRFGLSPVDALIDLKVRCRLRCQIPVWLGRNTLTDVRITVIPQRKPARRGYESANGRYGAGPSQTATTGKGLLESLRFLRSGHGWARTCQTHRSRSCPKQPLWAVASTPSSPMTDCSRPTTEFHCVDDRQILVNWPGQFD